MRELHGSIEFIVNGYDESRKIFVGIKIYHGTQNKLLGRYLDAAKI